MRLICGIFQLDGRNAPEPLLRAMAAQMDVPRLRPSIAFWQEGPAGLAVLDFSARKMAAFALPQRGTSVLAGDVRLDEPEALRRTVGDGATAGDDSLLLAALEKTGPSILEHVLGDFAFASWDKGTRRLICGRDAFGVRPFAYAHRPGAFFAFASFPRALHGSGLVSKIVDEDTVARRMVHALRVDDCPIANIKRLPPAHYLEASREGISLARYWQPDRAAVGSRNCSSEEAARELRRLVDQAVKCRLPGGGEIGAHLSGGLDSSAVAVLAARKLREDGRTLHAYSFLDRQRNDIALEDETEFVRAVVEQEGDLAWTPIRPPAGLSQWSEGTDADTMTALGAEQPDNATCAHAERQGVNIMLSGWGGDEGATFNGRGTLAELLLRGRWRTLAREASALGRERGWNWLQILNGEILSYLTPKPMVALARRIAGREPDLQSLLYRSLTPAARKHLAASRGEVLRMAPDGRKNRWRLMTSPHIAQRAEIWAQTGARHGLAFAFPLLDRRVVEYALSLPSELFLRGGFRRRPFRDAMADVLPEQVRLRHEKYQPFPGRLLDIADNKNEILSRIASYEKNERIRRTIDLTLLRRQVEAFPSPDTLRAAMRAGGNSTPTASMVAALHALAAADYLDQHGS